MQTILKSSIAALALSLSAIGAHAAPVTHQMTGTINGQPVSVVHNSPVLQGFNSRFSVFSPVQYSGFPSVFNDGDSIELSLTFTNGGLTLGGRGNDLLQYLFLPPLRFDTPFDFATDNPNGDPVLSYNRIRTVDIIDYAGDLISTTYVSPNSSVTSTFPQLGTIFAERLTDTSVTINQLRITTTFTNIMYLPGFEQFSSFKSLTSGNTFMLTIDQVENVPLPGALALIGVGLFGVFSLRRKTTKTHKGEQS